MMIRKILVLAALLQVTALPVMDAFAGNVGVDVNIRLGGEPRPVVVTQPSYPPPEPYYEEVEEEVDFVYPDELGFYVAVGVPYDLFYLNNRYYIYLDGRWLWSRSSRGGWVAARYRDLPPVIRRHRLERIREYRAREYDLYRHDREHYRGRHRSDKGYWKAARHEDKRREKEQRHEDKRLEKEQRREEKRYEKEQRREEKRYEKEQRREEKRLDKEQRRESHGRD